MEGGKDRVGLFKEKIQRKEKAESAGRGFFLLSGGLKPKISNIWGSRGISMEQRK